MERLKIEEFIGPENRYGDGSGYGYGSGYGDGSGYGSVSGYGYGSGSGDGYGYGDGSGYGYRYGYGYGYGSGSGYGYGSGYGSGSGIPKSINGEKIYMIDGVPTIIRHVRGNIAKGAILKNGLQLEDCFVVKQDEHFAHGETLAKAMEALREKLFKDMPEEERIKAFIENHDAEKQYPNMDFFDWHHRLTGSCEMGRRAFAERHNVDLNGSMTVAEFIRLTENDYGGNVIRKLRAHYEVTET